MQLPDEIEDIKRLSLRPGDVLVLRCSRVVSAMAADSLQERLRGIFGDRKVVVLGPDMEFEVVEPTGDDAHEVVR